MLGRLLVCVYVSPFIIWCLREGKPPSCSYAVSRVELWLSGHLTTLPMHLPWSESPNCHPWAEPASVRDAVRRQQWCLSNQLPRWHILMPPQGYYFSEQTIPATLTIREMFMDTAVMAECFFFMKTEGWLNDSYPSYLNISRDYSETECPTCYHRARGR